jgi:hypothetical protein
LEKNNSANFPVAFSEEGRHIPIVTQAKVSSSPEAPAIAPSPACVTNMPVMGHAGTLGLGHFCGQVAAGLRSGARQEQTL